MIGAFLLLAAMAESPAVALHPRYETVIQPLPDEGHSDRFGFARDSYQRMTVPVRLSGKGPYRFLVDTGSDRSAISRELAGSLGLAAGPSAILHSATGRSQVMLAVVPDLILSRRAARRIDAPMFAAADIGADGILGIDALRAERLSFDFVARTVAITTAERQPDPDERDAIIVRAQRRDGRLVVTDATAEGRHVSVVLDTGSQLSVGNAALRRALDRRGSLESLGPIELVSVTGAVLRGELAVVRELRIGDAQLRNLALVFAEAHTFRQLDLDRRPAILLGMNGLRSFDKVSIDFAARKLSLVVSAKAAAPRASPD